MSGNHDQMQQKHREDFQRYYRYLRLFRPVFILFNVFTLYLLFMLAGIRTIGILVALFIIIKEFIQLSFLWRIEKRIFVPILELKKGVEEIGRGNYSVRIKDRIPNEIGLLISSFNQMAEKLQESEKMKAEYEENRKSLIANISHDLKTPITSIQGYIEGILDGVVQSPEKVSKYLKIIYQNSEYMNKLIDDLFLFSKLDMEKLDFDFEKVPIREFMQDVMEEFNLELEEKECQFSYTDTLDFNPVVQIDRKRIYQAIRNIIGNAIKHGMNCDLQISSHLSAELNSVRLDIKDTGPGIPAEKLSHIFERFYRVDTERTKNLMSTGLGLAIAKELVEAHDGTITVQSVLGEGSCFTIKLPILQQGSDLS